MDAAATIALAGVCADLWSDANSENKKRKEAFFIR
jgi:hypothetical protein